MCHSPWHQQKKTRPKTIAWLSTHPFTTKRNTYNDKKFHPASQITYKRNHCESWETSVFAEWHFAENINLSLLLGIYHFLLLFPLLLLVIVLLLLPLVPLVTVLLLLALVPLVAALLLLPLVPDDLLLPHLCLVFSTQKEKNWDVWSSRILQWFAGIQVTQPKPSFLL